MMHFRHVLGMSAAAVTLGGLVLPTQAAVAAAPPPCDSAVIITNPATHVESLTADCVLASTWTVQDGDTFDGNGHTITVDSTFSGGPAIKSESGPAGGAPDTMTVEHLTIEAAGATRGIVFDGAKGAVHDVRVSGGSGIDYGVEIANTAGVVFATTIPPDQVKIDKGTTITGYRNAGVFAHDDVKFTLLRSVIGSPDSVSGQGVAGVLVTAGAHGSIKENHITLSDTEPAASDTAFGAGVEILADTAPIRRVEVKRNVFSGGAADFGISVSNPSQPKKLTAVVDCNLFRRNDTSASDVYGVGVAQWQASKLTNVQLTDSTFQGNWKHDTGTVVSGTSVSAGPVNNVRTATSTCAPPAPTHVFAAGGDRRSKVSWHASSAPEWAPLTGYKVSAKAAGHPAISKKVGPNATSATLKGLANKLTYKVTVTAQSNGGQAGASDMLYPTKMALRAKPGTIHRGDKSVLRGTLTSLDPKAHLAKRKVAIWAKPRGGHWAKIATVRTTSTGAFHDTVRPRKKTVYKAVYAGHPDLASSHRTTVVVNR